MAHLIDPRIEKYAERLTSPHEPLLAELSQATLEELGGASMLTGPVAGRFLELLVWSLQPQRVLEIGTFSGHSALAMAASLPEGGRIDACEIDPERAAVAQRFFDQADAGRRITLHVGPALETISRLEGRFDFVFIDADKGGYVDYYETVVPRLEPRGLIAVDNTLASGRVLTDPDDPAARFNEHVAADPRTVQVLLTVRDGITLIRLAAWPGLRRAAIRVRVVEGVQRLGPRNLRHESVAGPLIAVPDEGAVGGGIPDEPDDDPAVGSLGELVLHGTKHRAHHRPGNRRAR